MYVKNWMCLTIVALVLTSCNLPVADTSPVTLSPETPGVDAIGTAVALTTAPKMTELANLAVASLTDTPISTPTLAIGFTETPGTATTIPTITFTPCVPMVTANSIANLRSGPATAYDVIGSLPETGIANIAGRNEDNTWWYIEFSGGTGGHAWVAGSVVTAACLPAVVAVVAAPALPTAKPDTATPEVPTDAPPTKAPIIIVNPTKAPIIIIVRKPNLVASGMQSWPNPAKKGQPVSIQVKVTNSGSAAAGSFTVVWLSNQTKPGCSWTVSGLGIGASKDLNCTFTYGGNATATYTVTLTVDSGNQVAESNETDNSRSMKLYVKP